MATGIFSTHNAFPIRGGSQPYAESPWKFTDGLWDRISKKEDETDQGYIFKKCLVVPDDQEFDDVIRRFSECKPKGEYIRRINAVYKSHLTNGFKNHLHKINGFANDQNFASQWKQEKTGVTQREEVIKRWEHITDSSPPIKARSKGNETTLKDVRILDLWHGFNTRWKGGSICHHNFVVIPDGTKKVNVTDGGWYGKGIYGSTTAKYAVEEYCAIKDQHGKKTGTYNPHVLLCLFACRVPFPVVSEDGKRFEGQEHAQPGHDAHYIPINTKCRPCKETETAIGDELAVFESIQTLPKFWVEFQSETSVQGKLDQVATAEDLADYLIYYLQKHDSTLDDETKKVLKGKLSYLYSRISKGSNEYMEHDKAFVRFFKSGIQKDATVTFTPAEAAKWLQFIVNKETIVEIEKPVEIVKEIEKERDLNKEPSLKLLWELIKRPSVIVSGGGALLVVGLVAYVVRNYFLGQSGTQPPIQELRDFNPNHKIILRPTGEKL